MLLPERSQTLPKGGTSSVKASHWRNVKDSLPDVWSPRKVIF